MQRNALCRSRRELSDAYLPPKFGFDTAENETCKVCPIERCSSPAEPTFAAAFGAMVVVLVVVVGIPKALLQTRRTLYTFEGHSVHLSMSQGHAVHLSRCTPINVETPALFAISLSTSAQKHITLIYVNPSIPLDARSG